MKVFLLVASTVLWLTTATLRAADHLDAPLVGADGRTDINDLYVFQSPTNPSNTVMIMTVNPLAGVMSGFDFDPKASYDFNVDIDGDAIQDYTVRTEFSNPNRRTGEQRYKVRLLMPRGKKTLANGKTGESTSVRGGGKVAVGVYDDPFFFDLVGFQNGLAFDGTDFFAGLNVTAIAVEVPSSLFETNTIGVWASTEDRAGQIDRIGRPAINTVLIPSDRKDEFNFGVPADDFVDFGADVNAAITGLSGDADYAETLTGILLPDVLTVDTSDPAGFLNGRQLVDDVIDIELFVLTMGAFTAGDGVDMNDVPFSDRFPYLAPAH